MALIALIASLGCVIFSILSIHSNRRLKRMSKKIECNIVKKMQLHYKSTASEESNCCNNQA